MNYLNNLRAQMVEENYLRFTLFRLNKVDINNFMIEDSVHNIDVITSGLQKLLPKGSQISFSEDGSVDVICDPSYFSKKGL